MDKDALVHIERIEPAIAVVTMRREHKLNALTDALIEQLTDAACALREDASVKAVVLTGGRKAFSAGADIGAFAALEGGADTNAVRRATQKGVRLANEWQNLPAITIAAVEGCAVGGGFGLALSCDWRVFARDAWAYVPEVQLGLNYGWGTLPRLSALAGPARAKWISILCRRHPAPELAAWNIAEHVAEPGAALDDALALAREVAALPALAAQMIKQTVNAGSLALAGPTSYSDMDNMLVCLHDAEGQRARAAVTARVTGGPAR